METLVLKNFAKLKDATLNINDITLIAGKPGSGKSYIMKMLYAINEFYYKKLNENLVNNFIDEYKNILHMILKLSKIDKKSKEKCKFFLDNNNFEEYRKLLGKNLENENFDEIVTYNIKKINDLINLNENEKVSLFISNILNSIFSDYNQISSTFEVSYESLNIKLENENIDITFDEKVNLRNINDIVFVETPLILEFKKFMNKNEGKTPYHIGSLLKILDTDYSFKDKEQEMFIKEFTRKSKEIINGNIENSGDSFIYKRGDKNYDIVNASSGIKSIGLLQYLVTNKALKQGSVLFWEEPEVHLHPSWQLKMVELFLELQKNGVRIVFSTHSPYMADYLNALVKKRKLEDKVSFNLLTEEKDGVVENIILNDDNWKLLQDELLGALEEIMWEYL